MLNYRIILERVKQLDDEALNRTRIIMILSLTFVFGVFAYNATIGERTSSQTALAYPEAIEQTSFVTVKEQAKNGDEREVVSARANQGEEGDGAPIIPLKKNSQETTPQPVAVLTAPVLKDEPAADKKIALLTINLFARSAVAADATGKKIYFEKEGDMKLPMASLTKLMTAVIVEETLSPSDVITISPNAVRIEGAAGDLRAGETFTADDLLRIMLIVSSNDAAVAFQEYFTSQGMDLTALMNEKALALGMFNTHFKNPSGLDEANHVSTVRDLVKLVAYSYRHKPIWNALSARSDSVTSLNKKIAHTLISHNTLLTDAGVLGGKTGYTKNAQGCMITRLRDDTIVVVLGSEDRFGETRKIITMINTQ